MSEKALDRRVRKTKSQLKTALTQLMAEKGIRDISVKELTELADINRGTFYLHYKDIFDMVDSLEQEMFDEFNHILNDRQDNEESRPLSILIDVFKFLQDNSKMCMVLLGPNGDVAFMDRLKNLVREKCLRDWMSYYSEKNAQNFEYYYSFIVSGCTGLFMKWLEEGMKETPEQMSALAGQMILYGVKVLY